LNIYMGPGSAYAKREGVYVPGRGVDLQTGVSIAALILRDLRRGWSYDHSGRVVEVDRDLAWRRLRYLYPLCLKHTGDCERLREALVRIMVSGRIPPEYAHLVRLEGPAAHVVASELEALGILPAAAKPLVRARVRVP